MATVLTLSATADDTYTAYLSTSPTADGIQFLINDGTWQTPESGSTTLTAGVTNYLHLTAHDVFGAPTMLIADAGLSDGGFTFANGTNRLLTNTTDWSMSLVGFGGAPTAVVDLGQNGASPWGNVASISSDAHFIWSDEQPFAVHYFTVAITPVPEPASLVVLGLGALVLQRRRK